MRNLRVTSAVVLAGALIAAVPILTANAATAPSAPYTAFTLDPGQSTRLVDRALAFDPENTTSFRFGPFSDAPAEADHLSVHAVRGDDSWSAAMAPPIGTNWVAGRTYETQSGSENETRARFETHRDYSPGCGHQQLGQLTIRQIVREAGTGRVTAFAASFRVSCAEDARGFDGEIRYNSSVGYVAAVADKGSLDFGAVREAANSAPQTVRFTGAGSAPVRFGAATFTGATPGSFTVSADGCNGVILDFGESCTVQVRANPTVFGPQTAHLALADNTGAGRKIVHLLVDGLDSRSLAINPSEVYFGPADLDLDSPPVTLTVTSNGTRAITLGSPSLDGPSPEAFRVTGSTCTGVTLAIGQRCAITVVARPTRAARQAAWLDVPDDSRTGSTLVRLDVEGGPTPRGTFYPKPPERILDTRSGVGAPKGAVGGGRTIDFQVTGRGGLALSGVSAVVLNLTVTGPTGPGHVTAYPTGVTRPTASSLNYTKGWTGANSVTVAVGTGGRVSLYNHGASAHLIADVTGYYAGDNNVWEHGGRVGGAYHPITPTRLVDTRGGPKVPAGYYFNAAASWDPAIDPHVKAFAVNITAVGPAAGGHLIAWNGDPNGLPTTSVLNYTAGKTVPNLAIVPTKPCVDCDDAEGWPSIGVYTHAATHVLVDLVGYFDDSTLTDGLRFTPLTPSRIVDSRIGLGVAAPIGPDQTVSVAAAPSGTNALALNVTAVAPTAGTFLTVWPSGESRPWASNLNPAAGQTVPNAAITGLGTNRAFSLYNAVGSTNVVVDAVGRYWLYPGTAGARSPAARSAAGPPEPRVFQAEPRRSELG